jgi:hypothetical protein
MNAAQLAGLAADRRPKPIHEEERRPFSIAGALHRRERQSGDQKLLRTYAA